MIAEIKTSNTILYCTKWRETVDFYAEVLQLDIHFSNEWFVEFSVNPHARISIANQERASIPSANGKGITIALQIDELEKMHDYLAKMGAAPTPIKTLWNSHVFYIYDPEGNRLEFWS